MANEKMTKKMWFNEMVKLVAESDRTDEFKVEATAFVEHEMELLNRKSGKSKAQLEKEQANADATVLVVDVLRERGVAMTVTELLKDERLADMTSQKLTYLLNHTDDVTRTVVKKRAFYSATAVDAE